MSPGVHGPYRLDAIALEKFNVRDALTARGTLEDWVHRDGPVSEHQIEGNLAEVYRLIEEADVCLELPDLGEAAYHDGGFILDKPFIEFVLVGPEDRLVLIVASGNSSYSALLSRCTVDLEVEGFLASLVIHSTGERAPVRRLSGWSED